MTLRKFPLRRLLNPIPFTGITNVVIGIIGVLSGIAAARILGPHGRGELAAIQIWPSVAGTLALVGLPEAVVYFTARNEDRSGKFLGSAMTLAVLLAIPTMVVTWLAMPLLLRAQSDAVVAASRWYLLIVVAYVFSGIPLFSLRGKRDFRLWNIMRIIPAAGWLAVLLISRLLSSVAPQSLAFRYLTFLLALGFPVVVWVQHRLSTRLEVDSSTWKPMLAFGLPTALASVPGILNLRLDQMVMASTLSPERLGLYATAVAWASAVQPLAAAVGTVLFPRVATERDSENRAARLQEGVRLGVLVAGSLGIVIAIATPVALPIAFGPTFAPVVPVAMVLVLASSIWSVNGVLEEGLRGLGRPRYVLLAQTLGIVLIIPALVLLLPAFGIMGAAIASVVAYAAVMVMLTSLAGRAAGVTAGTLLRPRFPRAIAPEDSGAPIEADSAREAHRFENPMP